MELNYPDSVKATQTRRYRICGIVQGVGFRPFVNRLARKYNAHGWVLNDSEGVLLEVQAEDSVLDLFIDELVSQPPPLAHIVDVKQVSATEVPPLYEGFEIRKSVDMNRTDTIIPPDTGVCEDCLGELRDPHNFRYQYAFINCTNCGPRYSLIQGMPYDRPQTTMRSFHMCEKCQSEYDDIDDRRYHAQPNACPSCGPSLELTDRDGTQIKTDDVIRYTIERLKEGAVCAIKSVGGFHLAVDATNTEAVNKLRKRKKRDSKPFAVMLADCDAASEWAFITPEEQALLESMQRPIVLLKRRSRAELEAVAPRNPDLGVMLPSAPLHYLLLSDPKLPMLVMTSGNASGHPIAYENRIALEQLNNIADYFLFNDRDIQTRVDDSVIRVIDLGDTEKPIYSFLRRSRGYAPFPIHLPYSIDPTLALGAELKTTISVGKANQVFMSQHVGDLKNDTTFQSHHDGVQHLEKLLSVEPERIACDLHPNFRSTRAALQNNEKHVVQVQHHHAHMVSCMAENGLSGKTLGVIFDGTGYGLDGTIWGGEFLVGDSRQFTRVGHLKPLYLLGGDSAVKDPIRVAVSLLCETFGNEAFYVELPSLNNLATERREVFIKMALGKINAIPTTSMGRFFDGISALMGVCEKVEYEAQAPIELEAMLQRNYYTTEPLDYAIEENNGIFEINYQPLVKQLVGLLQNPKADLALLSRRFHSTVVDLIGAMCIKLANANSCENIVLSGGVFCNSFLLKNAYTHLKSLGLKPYIHRVIPSNDGGISLGQVVVAAHAE